MEKVTGIVVAAGLSSRMKKFKPLLTLGSKTVIERTIESLECCDRIVVVLGHQSQFIEQTLQRMDRDGLSMITNPHYQSSEMLRSIQMGLEAEPSDYYFLLPGDMPNVRKSTVRELYLQMKAHPTEILFPSDGHRRGHPPIFTASLAKKILSYRGDGGLREILKNETKMAYFKTTDPGCFLDLDVWADYEIAKKRWEST